MGSTGRPGRRAGQQPGDMRRQLLACALEVLLEGGEVSLREVARRAGVAPGAPYHHFPDKETLLLALAEQGFEELGQELTRATEGAASPEHRLRRMMAAYLRFALSHGPHYRLMFSGQLRASVAGWTTVASAAFQRLSVAVAAVRTDLPPERVMGAATQAWAHCHGVVMLRLEGLLDDASALGDEASIVDRTVAAAEAIVHHEGSAPGQASREGSEPPRTKKR